jgi:NTE family protein
MFYDRVIALPDLIGSGVFAGVSGEIGKIKDRFDQGPSPGTLWSGSVFLGADTFAGPGFVGFGFGGGGNWSLYLLLGSPK